MKRQSEDPHGISSGVSFQEKKKKTGSRNKIQLPMQRTRHKTSPLGHQELMGLPGQYLCWLQELTAAGAMCCCLAVPFLVHKLWSFSSGKQPTGYPQQLQGQRAVWFWGGFPNCPTGSNTACMQRMGAAFGSEGCLKGGASCPRESIRACCCFTMEILVHNVLFLKRQEERGSQSSL